ncbi:hypothetical protein Tco_0908716 [Tanacetum coccineum]|uniref:Uncharacterized protein n=1 Tax=Tanacetum coccineum TaxID=301880 RepID=A0ABQ5CRE2_9ASTR
MEENPNCKFFTLWLLMNNCQDGENLDKMKEKGDACIFVGYSTQSKATTVVSRSSAVTTADASDNKYQSITNSNLLQQPLTADTTQFGYSNNT